MGERLEMMTIVFPWANSFCGTCQGFAWMGNKKILGGEKAKWGEGKKGGGANKQKTLWRMLTTSKKRLFLCMV